MCHHERIVENVTIIILNNTMLQFMMRSYKQFRTYDTIKILNLLELSYSTLVSFVKNFVYLFIF